VNHSLNSYAAYETCAYFTSNQAVDILYHPASAQQQQDVSLIDIWEQHSSAVMIAEPPHIIVQQYRRLVFPINLLHGIPSHEKWWAFVSVDIDKKKDLFNRFCLYYF
jgi:hypothetical protein